MIRSCTLRRRPMSVCPTCRPKCCRKCCLGVLLCSVVALTHTYSSPPLLARGSSCTSDMNRGLHTHALFFSRHTPPRHIYTHTYTHTHTHITTLTVALCFARCCVITRHTHTVAYIPLRPQHTDNSFGNSLTFTQNNILGTHTLLEAAKVAGMYICLLYSTVCLQVDYTSQSVSCIVSFLHLHANDISTDSTGT